MTLRAGCAQMDITPTTLPIEKPGWIIKILADRVDDPLFANVMVLDEPFTAIGVEIKMNSPFRRTYVVGCANGMVGYVPTAQAFERGGYETTLSMGSKLDPAAAKLLTNAAAKVLRAVQ